MRREFDRVGFISIGQVEAVLCGICFHAHHTLFLCRHPIYLSFKGSCSSNLLILYCQWQRAQLHQSSWKKWSSRALTWSVSLSSVSNCSDKTLFITPFLSLKRQMTCGVKTRCVGWFERGAGFVSRFTLCITFVLLLGAFSQLYWSNHCVVHIGHNQNTPG